jgi:hypothetical protein
MATHREHACTCIPNNLISRPRQYLATQQKKVYASSGRDKITGSTSYYMFSCLAVHGFVNSKSNTCVCLLFKIPKNMKRSNLLELQEANILLQTLKVTQSCVVAYNKSFPFFTWRNETRRAPLAYPRRDTVLFSLSLSRSLSRSLSLYMHSKPHVV